MSTLIAYADGNLTGSTTFKGAETGTSALAMVRANFTTLLTAGTITSPTFTATNAKVFEGVLLWVYLSAGTAGTGTFKVDLQKGGVSQASVTVNKSDLPDATNTAPVPVFFKFTSTATGDGGSNWTIVLTNTSGTGSGVVSYSRNSATSGDLTRAIRTSTTATAAAADDLYIVGELTGAATHNSRAVTMDSTATTAYGNGTVNSTAANGGGIRVSNYGTLSYGTSASTNYVLRINGDLEVYQFGTLNIGSSGAEIPRTSTAVLEFQQVSASGDFGLIGRNSSTINIAGLSRTVGKNVSKCKLTADVTGSNVLTSGPTALNVTNATSGGLDIGTSLLASTAIDTVTNANHTLAWSAPSITNTTQTFQVWLARGTGTNNRFVRLEVGNNSVLASVTKGFFADVDLQAGTIGTCTAVGTGTATSSSITVVGGGYLCNITGKVDASAATPTVFIAICSAAGTTSFAGANNQALLYEGVQLVTASSIGNTTFNVDTDSGWKSGDLICVATTNRTPADCEDYVLNADAGASSMTSALHPLGYGGPTTSVTGTVHNGTSPLQAEVGLLTRNIKIRSTSSSLMSYVYAAALAAVTASWAEFYYLGTNVTSKRGIEVDALTTGTAGAKSITYCSVHDGGFAGLYSNTASLNSLNLTFSNNVMWNMTSTMITLLSSLTLTDWTIDNNLLMKGGSIGMLLGDVGGTCTNNALVGMSGFGFSLQETTTAGAIIGSFDSNTVHSGNNHGWVCQAAYPIGTVSHLASWRNNACGIFLGSTCTANLIFSDMTVFGNGSIFGNFDLSSGDTVNIIGTSNIIAGDTTFSSPVGFGGATTQRIKFNFQNVDMSGTTSIYAAHTSTDFSLGTANAVCVEGTVTNSKFGAPTVLQAKTTWSIDSYISFEKYGQTAGDHRTEMTYGQLKTDSAIFNAASPSMRMTPNSASSKLESAPKGRGILVPVANGNTAAVQVAIYKSKTGDGAAYNGNQPRLIQRANASLGQNSDVVLGTYGSGTGSWNVLSANTSTATDDGAFEIVVDCDGTAGWINVDDWQVA